MKRELGIFAPADPEMLKWALEAPLMQYSGPKDQYFENNGNIIPSANAALYLALSVFSDPGEVQARDRVIAHLKHLVAGGNEPGFNAGPFWHYETVSMLIALCRYIPEVWQALSCDEQNRLDLVMRCFAIASAFVTNDPNEYKTGPSLSGNYYKLWNPNHRMAMTMQIVAAKIFFSAEGKDGAKVVNDLLLSFDHAAYIADFERYGFVRAKYYWDTKGMTLDDGRVAPGAAELMMDGGEAFLCHLDSGAISNGLKLGAYAGDGVGVRHTYSYFGMGLDNIVGIVRHMYDYNYSGGAVISDTSRLPGGTDENGKPLAYIADGSLSPVEGKIGMMRELVSADAGGIRSSTSYCLHDFILVVQSYAVLYALGELRLSNDDPLFSLMWVGNEDVIYKCEVGYNSYSIGKNRGICGEAGHPDYLPDKHLWRANFAPRLSL